MHASITSTRYIIGGQAPLVLMRAVQWYMEIKKVDLMGMEMTWILQIVQLLYRTSDVGTSAS